MRTPRPPLEDRPQLPCPPPPEPREREEESSAGDDPKRGVLIIPILEPEESPQ